MKFTAAGDMIIQKPIYPGYEGFGALADFIKQGDARFFNLETTLNHEGETCASQFSGGTYIRTIGESGTAKLTVSAHGLKPVTVEFAVE